MKKNNKTITGIAAYYGISYSKALQHSKEYGHPTQEGSVKRNKNVEFSKRSKVYDMNKVMKYYKKLGIERRLTPEGELSELEFADFIGVDYSYFRRLLDIPAPKRTDYFVTKSGRSTVREVCRYYDKSEAEEFKKTFVYGESRIRAKYIDDQQPSKEELEDIPTKCKGETSPWPTSPFNLMARAFICSPLITESEVYDV